MKRGPDEYFQENRIRKYAIVCLFITQICTGSLQPHDIGVTSCFLMFQRLAAIQEVGRHNYDDDDWDGDVEADKRRSIILVGTGSTDSIDRSERFPLVFLQIVCTSVLRRLECILKRTSPAVHLLEVWCDRVDSPCQVKALIDGYDVIFFITRIKPASYGDRKRLAAFLLKVELQVLPIIFYGLFLSNRVQINNRFVHAGIDHEHVRV